MTAPLTVSNALEHDVIPVNVSFKLIRRCFRFTQYNKEKANVVRLESLSKVWVSKTFEIN